MSQQFLHEFVLPTISTRTQMESERRIQGLDMERISQGTLCEELYLLCSNQEQERYKDLPNCVTAVLVALINYSPQ